MSKPLENKESKNDICNLRKETSDVSDIARGTADTIRTVVPPNMPTQTPDTLETIARKHPSFVMMNVDSETAKQHNLGPGFNTLGNELSLRNLNPMNYKAIQRLSSFRALHQGPGNYLLEREGGTCIVDLRPLNETEPKQWLLQFLVPAVSEYINNDTMDKKRSIGFCDSGNRAAAFQVALPFDTRDEAEEILRRLEQKPSEIWPFFEAAASTIPIVRSMLDNKDRAASPYMFEGCSYAIVREDVDSFDMQMTSYSGKQLPIPDDFRQLMRHELTEKEWSRLHPPKPEPEPTFRKRIMEWLSEFF